ncbi:MAG: pyruvate dehydrogenase complex dihydrolipoamide acetyltransferase [Proteobacteria bacterium]|nr:pyruvate dehydrogenase complex dihydrolipoamide acetyltransferase [Pseudomonadota bacterium]
MATVMEMPKLSDTMKEGAVARWLKKEGEKVTAGHPVVEIETDKATMEFESPASGTLIKIIVGDKQTCDLNAPIAVIGKPEESWQEALDKYSSKKKGGAAAPAAKAAAAAPAAATAPAAAATTGAATSTMGRLRASPLAKRVAADKGIDLSSVQGSGPNGRIVVRDVENITGGTSGGVSLPAFSGTPAAEMEKVSLSMMRKTIARRLVESTSTAPHFYLTVSINMGPLLAWRKATLSKVAESDKFSVNDLIVFLVSRALRKHPNINSSWQNDFIAQYNSVHMGVAVALPAGLVTPVVRHADKLSLVQIAQKNRELIKLARDGKLQPDDYAGGTFTISNLGMSGIEEFTAIINPPQAAILAVGSTVATPVVDDEGEITVEQRMRVTLSCDHRVIDGAQGAEFLKTLKSYFEDPMACLFMG